MRKNICFLLCFFYFFSIFANEHELKNVPIEYIGTYIPVEMEEYLKEYMAYEKALNKSHKSNYDILILEENICYSDQRFSDGYAIDAENFEKWTFVTKGKEKYIIDENNKSYRRLTDNNDERYDAYTKAVLSILFADAIHNKNIEINGNKIKIYGNEYKFELWPYYIADDEVLYLSGNILKIDGLSANIYETEAVGKWDIKRTERIIQTIPLFFWNDSNYPDLNLDKYKSSRTDLRLLRNLVYAKHGYKFKSEDLNKIFSEFDWYKVNPNFSEKNFSTEERQLIQRIQKYESEMN